MDTTKNNTTKRKHYRSRHADDKQAELYKRFPADSFLGNESNMDHFMQWVTFFRRNLHRFASDYLGIKLHLYQTILLYLMGVNNLISVIASRASAKSFIIALYICIKCILYPNSLVVLASGTKGQAKLLVSEKIQKELMGMSPMLRREIVGVKNNQNEIIVNFRNNSSITVVTSSDNSRGYRSTVLVREEFRQIKKSIEDGILSPFQIIRQTPYSKNEYYANIKELVEKPVDIYISSSYFDNDSEETWMWKVVDQAYDEMLEGKASCLLAFDESIALKHKIKTMRYFQTQKKKQDPLTWQIEFLNVRLKENRSAFFTYGMLTQNQVCMKPFYPKTSSMYRSGKKNPYAISKVPGEVRLVAADMAFIQNEQRNDNSVFTCMRLLPESITHQSETAGEFITDNGYRRIACYIESVQGGEIRSQAIRIRELYEDFEADYICLDTRNAGVAVYDVLARTLFDESRDVEYPALTCMNDDGLANRIKVEGAEPRIFAVNASQKLNSDIAIDFRRILAEKKIDFLIGFEKASEEILPNIKEYISSPDADTMFFYEAPFLETQALFAETAGLLYERRPDTGVIVIHESGSNRKDRYTSCSYASYFAGLLERDLLSQNDDYEYSVFIN